MEDVEVIPLFVVKKKEYKQREFKEKEKVENKKLPRLYISNIPYGTLEKDIKLLIEKVSPVREIYIPGSTPTGLYRDFAIVTLEFDDNEGEIPSYDGAILAALKCVKALNNCIWKSVKIKVEIAKEHYIDTRKREIEENEELNMDIIDNYTDNEAIDDYSSDDKPLFNRNVLRFRKSRYSEPIIISCRPNLIKDMNEITKKITKNKKTKLDCGYKIKFLDDSDDERNYNEYVQEQNELFKASEFVIDKFGIEKQRNEKTLESKSIENEKSVDKVVEVITKTGGGLRKGFGTLIGSGSTVKVPANIVALRSVLEDDECCVENHSFSNKPVENMNSEFGDGEEEEDPHPYDSDEEGGQSNELCVQSEDIVPQALVNERKRALALITNMFGGDDKNNVSNKEDDDDSLLAVPVIQSRKGWDSVLIKRFDPTKDDSVDKFEVSAEDRIKNAMNNTISMEKKENSNISNNSSIIVEDSQGDAKGYADLNELKDIFYKEGGVWWGDDGTLNEAVSRGGAGQDKLFLEAEKLGFDIRSTTQKSEESSVMKFGFFDEESNNFDSNSDKVTAEPKTTEQKWKQVIHNDKIEWLPDNGEVEVEKEKKQMHHSLLDIVRNAKKFSRDKPISTIVSDWKESRIKLAVDYKRKRKESRKKIGIQAPLLIGGGIKGNNPSNDAIGSQMINSITSSNKKAGMKGGKSYRGGSKNKSKK
jgi:hypothetical protein